MPTSEARRARWTLIASLLDQDDAITQAEIAGECGVSETTISADLRQMGRYTTGMLVGLAELQWIDGAVCLICTCGFAVDIVSESFVDECGFCGAKWKLRRERVDDRY